MKKIVIMVLGVLLLGIFGYLFSNYNTLEYIYEDLVLSNNIRTLGIMTQDDVDLLSQIDVDVVIGNNLTGGWSMDRSVPLWDNNWGYAFVHKDRTQQLLLRAQVQKVWRIENLLSMTCEGPGCPQPWWVNIFDMIIHDVKPTHIVDIVVLQSGQQTIIQGTGGYRVGRLIQGP